MTSPPRIGWILFSLACITLILGAISLFSESISTGWGIIILAFAYVYISILLLQKDRLESESLIQRESEIVLLKAELEEQRSEVDALADGLDVAIFICDKSAAILYANYRAKQIFNFDTPLNRGLLAVTLSAELERTVLSVPSEGERIYAEISFTHPESRVGRVVAWCDSSGNRLFVSIYEITDLRRLERARQDFVANVSHEIRTPLTIIRASAETTLDDTELPKERISTLMERIISEVDRLSLITGDLLILSSAELGPVRKVVCNFGAVWGHVCNMLRSSALDKGLELKFSGTHDLIIEANETQMHQVALNLVQNAINYTLSGHVWVRVYCKDDFAFAEVQDTGLGIGLEHQERIFERFYRVDRARSRVSGGTGLGLSIVRHIVEAHGGSVSVESELNSGSTFTVCLPIGTSVK